MQIVHTDLDNTLIYSYKHEIGGPKTCVEIYQGREISFMTETSHRLLGQLCSKPGVLVVPTTTRTLEQYQRIDLGIGVSEYALVCNGGVLLHQGKEDPIWYQESLALIVDAQSELQRAEQWMTEDVNRCFEVRNIRSLFLFTKSNEPEKSVAMLKAHLNLSLVEVFCNGIKVYVLPKKLNKGSAVRRFRKRVAAETVYAAGDSAFDVPMIQAADIGMAPKELLEQYELPQTGNFKEKTENKIQNEEKKIFSDQILAYLLECLS